MKKLFFKILIITITHCSIFACAKQNSSFANLKTNSTFQKVVIKNNINKPVILNFYINTHEHTGYFGLLVDANTIKTLEIPEFFWFDKQAIGGLKIPGKSSQVKVIDVLKHGIANTFDISIPDEEFKTFFIQPGAFSVTISPGDETSTVKLQELK